MKTYRSVFAYAQYKNRFKWHVNLGKKGLEKNLIWASENRSGQVKVLSLLAQMGTRKIKIKRRYCLGLVYEKFFTAYTICLDSHIWNTRVISEIELTFRWSVIDNLHTPTFIGYHL